MDTFGDLRLDKDPKEIWAENHPEFYPVRINKSDREALLRVSGIGPKTVGMILKMRREKRITCFEDLGSKVRTRKGKTVCDF